MVPISIDELIEQMVKSNKCLNKKETKKNILEAAERKKNGAECIQCYQPIWAIGSGVTGTNMCHTCITGEANDSEDYELDTVCF